MRLSSTHSTAYQRPRQTIGELRRFANLLRALVLRELTTRYRRAALGLAWSVLQPLGYLAIFLVVRSALRIPGDDTIPYAVFAFSALVPWTFFANAVIRSASSISASAPVIKKIAVAHEVFPASVVVVSLFDLLVSLLLLAGLMAYFAVPIGWPLLWLPAIVLLAGLLAFAVGLGVAAAGTAQRDIVLGMPFVMQIWLLATPILYPLASVPEHLQWLYRLNPLVGIIESFRSVTVLNSPPDLALLASSAGVTALVLLVTWPLFRLVSRYFADIL